MDSPDLTTPVSTTTISLNDVADRYLSHYQKLFDISMFSLSSFRKANEQDYDEFAQQLIVMPKNNGRMTFDKAKDATETWVLKHVLSEALGSVVPLMEDCRTICALCDFKTSKKKQDPADLQAITAKQRQDFIALPLAAKFALLKEKYGMESEVQEHVQSLLQVTRALARDSVLTETETEGKPETTLKIRAVTLIQNPAKGPGGEASVNLSRKVVDNQRVVKVGDKITFSKAEQFGSLVTMAIFLGSMLQGVQAYAKKTGAANS